MQHFPRNRVPAGLTSYLRAQKDILRVFHIFSSLAGQAIKS